MKIARTTDLYPVCDTHYAMLIAGDNIRRISGAPIEPYLYWWQAGIDLLGPEPFNVTTPNGYHWDAANIWELELKENADLKAGIGTLSTDQEKLLCLMATMYNLNQSDTWAQWMGSNIGRLPGTPQAYSINSLAKDNTLQPKTAEVIHGLLATYTRWGQI